MTDATTLLAERDRALARVRDLEAILDAPVVALFADGRDPTANERHLLNLLAWRQREAETAKARLDFTYCAYCGHEEPIDGDGGKIAEHVRLCAKHPMRAAEARVAELEDAVRLHRDQRGDDRCHLDDGALYAALPEGDTRPARETAVTIENCRTFIERRQAGREYVSPQRRIDELQGTLRAIGDQARELARAVALTDALVRRALGGA